MAGIITLLLFVLWMVALCMGALLWSIVLGSCFILSFLIASANVKTKTP